MIKVSNHLRIVFRFQYYSQKVIGYLAILVAFFLVNFPPSNLVVFFFVGLASDRLAFNKRYPETILLTNEISINISYIISYTI